MGDMRTFLEDYDRVFDEEGNVKNCGRGACIDLILSAFILDPSQSYGDSSTGYMNVENIKNLRNSILGDKDA